MTFSVNFLEKLQIVGNTLFNGAAFLTQIGYVGFCFRLNSGLNVHSKISLFNLI